MNKAAARPGVNEAGCATVIQTSADTTPNHASSLPPKLQRPQLNRALPELMVTLMSDGLDERTARNPKKVFGAVVSVAMSAYLRGWTEVQFIGELTRDTRNSRTLRRHHRLWEQLSARCSELSAYKQTHKAWECAVAYVNDVGDRTLDDLRADAVERAYLWADRITDGSDGLSVTEAAVLGYVVSETERRRMLRVTCPSRTVGEAAKVSAITASRTLNALADKEFLVKRSSGRVSDNPTERRAAIYSLADPETLPHGGIEVDSGRRRRGRRSSGT